MSAASPTFSQPARRQVTYDSLADMLRDARRLVAANAGATGEWSLGQIIQHLAMALNASVDGFGFTLPWPLRIVGRYVIKGRILRNGMQPGIQLPAAAVPALAPPAIDPATALRNLELAVAHFEAAQSYAPHPAFGPITAEEANLIQLRHAELHLSFVEQPK